MCLCHPYFISVSPLEYPGEVSVFGRFMKNYSICLCVYRVSLCLLNSSFCVRCPLRWCEMRVRVCEYISWRLILILLIFFKWNTFLPPIALFPLVSSLFFNLLNRKLFIIHAQNLFSRFFSSSSVPCVCVRAFLISLYFYSHFIVFIF